MLYSWIFFIYLLLDGVQSSRILLVFPMPLTSHYILGNALARGLAEAGHDVTMVSCFKENDPPKNGTYRDILLNGIKDDLPLSNFFEMENTTPFIGVLLTTNKFSKITYNVFEHPNFQTLLHSNETFDVVIAEVFNNDAVNGLAYHFNAPLIFFSSLGPNEWTNPLVGNPSPLSYIPHSLLKYTSDMTFYQRTINWLFSMTAEISRSLIYFPEQNRIMKKHLPHVPDLSVISSNASIIFLNNHESINQAVPHVPSMIDIGGFHINAPKQLPKDLNDFMESAQEGVVYFSMGSNIKPSTMPLEKKDAILKSFKKLKQKILWKWDEDILSEKPDNVMLSKWFPQQDILAHPNTKLFITHGGLLSTVETIYHGVPILVFPIFGDQKMNAARAEKNGFGLALPFSEITEEKLTDALHKLLNDPKYQNNVKWRSQLLHDRPVKPMDLAVYWTEFVIRNRGAPHLRVAGVDLPWYKYLLLDVVIFLVLVSICLIASLLLLFKKICYNSRNRKTEQISLVKKHV